MLLVLKSLELKIQFMANLGWFESPSIERQPPNIPKKNTSYVGRFFRQARCIVQVVRKILFRKNLAVLFLDALDSPILYAKGKFY